jgi:hypothetical protein
MTLEAVYAIRLARGVTWQSAALLTVYQSSSSNRECESTLGCLDRQDSTQT